MSADNFFTGDGSPAAVHRLLSGNIAIVTVTIVICHVSFTH